MIRILSIFQWVLFLAILTVAFRHSYRAGRITLFAVCFTWFMTLAVMAAFAIFASSLSQPDREHWARYSPDGLNVFAITVMGWMNGLVVAVLAVGVRRVIRKEPLFRFLKADSQGRKPDA
jgi:sulfite exporter TauE/SafE